MPLFRVAKPRVKLIRTTLYNWVANNVNVPWEAVQWSEGEAMWAGGVPTDLVIPRDGVWLLQAVANRANIAVAAQFTPRINVNGVSVVNMQQGDETRTIRTPLSTVEQLAAGDVVTLMLSTNNVATALPTTVSATNLFLSATRIGPQRWT